MKTIVLYATKYGAAREIAQRITEKIDGAVSHDLKQNNVPDLTSFDCIIIGASVYAGSLRKEARDFVSQNEGVLLQKKLGLFISGIGEGDGMGYFKKSYPNGVLQNAKATGLFGGIFDPRKANFLERLIMRIITKQSGIVNNINEEKIDQFVGALKS